MMYHNPVMLDECIKGMNIDPEGVYADVTFGGGGHSRAILERLTTGHLYAFDQDEDAAANAIDDARFTFIPQNFKYFKNFIQLYHGGKIDGVIADLGVSSHQFDTPEKGFSTRFDGALDMRMSQSNPLDAATVVNTYDQEALARILSLYGEVQQAHLVASDIVMARDNEPIETTAQLKAAVANRLPRGRENKVLAQIFQALRIEVNQELDALTAFLSQCPDVLKSGGRLVVMSYHSLEDRIVKNFTKTGNAEGKEEKDFFGNLLTPYKIITRKPITPSEEEIERNSRARSAKLRIAERK
ncbi:MAG: 16S rRNA (cytosine(1402)-N(4))-methyltransferase RsmH [Bacteroidales bacterium]|jgi:16S rRNA (cytosine1402-N4)-methyltransferase|nr:16S rRNA (cytosine(1402)-N(4))-methyltransferase RsmH [Bacteroidales bacterium]MBR3428313.1 16S rRNA (cytosine(1402)-N(4))-methyltransferase RsmH [Bacteroidales bacterium]